MTDADAYVELRCRSAFSFLAGASLPDDLVARAAALHYDTLSIVDRDGVYGAPRAFRAAQAAGLRALVGADVAIAGRRLALLVAERHGYRNLCRLITRGKLRAPKGQCVLEWGDLEDHAGGLVALVAGGPDAMLDGADDAAVAARVDRLRSMFGEERLYVEIHRHFERREEAIARRAIHVSARL